MMRALKAEFGKLKGSRTLMWSAVVVLGYAVLATTLNIALLKNADFGKGLASAGGAFKLAVEQGFYVLNWKNQLRVAVQGITGTWGVLLFTFVTAYVFGREYKERTSKNMLTTPLRREYYVAAKLVVVVCWAFALMLLTLVLHSIALVLLRVPGFSWGVLGGALLDAITVTALLALTLPLVAWITLTGRGYLRAMLFALGVQMAGNALVTTDVSRYWPWNMPVHLVGASWLPVVSGGLPAASWAVAVAVAALGTVLALRRIDIADDAS